MDRLISVATAKLAKSLGFDLKAQAFYGCDDPAGGGPGNKLMLKTWVGIHEVGQNESQEGTEIYSAPTQTALAKWILDKFNVFVSVDMDPDIYKGLMNYHPIMKETGVDREGLALRVKRPKQYMFQKPDDAMELGLLLTLTYLHENSAKPNSEMVVKKKRIYVYRLQPGKEQTTRTFEIGYLEEPISEYRKEYPDSWCDARICEGFWGMEETVKKLIELLNLNQFEL